MLASGDWVTIRYNGVKYFEKPPFQMWMTALAFQAFGIGEWQARLWVALSGALGVVMTAVAARRWFGPRVALLSALVLVAAPAWNLASHFNSLDMGLSGALACVLAAVLIAQHPAASPSQRRRWMWLAWAAMAVALLTKGLIGVVLPGLVLVVYCVAARDFAVWRRIHLVSGALITLALAAPWFVLVSLRNPEFAHFFFIHEHFERYLTTVHHRDRAVVVLRAAAAGRLPALARAFARHRRRRSRRPARPAISADDPAGRLGADNLRLLQLLELQASRLHRADLPRARHPRAPSRSTGSRPRAGSCTSSWRSSSPPAVSRRRRTSPASAPRRRRTRSIARSRPGSPAPASSPSSAWCWRGSSTGATSGEASSSMRSRSSPRRRVLMRGHEVFGRNELGGRSGGVAAGRRRREPRSTRCACSTTRCRSTCAATTIMVEAARRARRSASPRSRRSGCRRSPISPACWTSGPRAFAIMAPATYALLVSQGVPMTLVARDTRRVVVTNGAKPSP